METREDVTPRALAKKGVRIDRVVTLLSRSEWQVFFRERRVGESRRLRDAKSIAWDVVRESGG